MGDRQVEIVEIQGAEGLRRRDVEHAKPVTGSTDGCLMTLYRLSNLGLLTE
jgi:hypothetical protein